MFLEELRASQNGNSADRRTVVCSRQFALFVRTLTPYFDVLGLCIRLKTEWIDCFWGIVRLTFKVSTFESFQLVKL